MLKKTITYKTIDGPEVTEEFYFHLSKAEITELFVTKGEGFISYLRNIVAAGNGAEIIREFKAILAMSYGIRVDDGRRFKKSPELWEEFTQTEAYSQLFMQLVTDAEFAAEFVKGIMPPDLAEAVGNAVPEAKEIPGRPIQDVELPEQESNDDLPKWFKENRKPTKAELMKMSKDELALAMRLLNS